jgi:hypothetical protein
MLVALALLAKRLQSVRKSELCQVPPGNAELCKPVLALLDDRCLVKGADPTLGLAVELAASVVESVDSIRQANLLERPLHPQDFRLAAPLRENAPEAIERNHDVLRRRLHALAHTGAYATPTHALRSSTALFSWSGCSTGVISSPDSFIS